MSRLTNYGEAAIADWFRGVAPLTLPTQWHIGLLSAASDSAFTELTGTGYARQPVDRTLATWSGTQGAGTTLASSGVTHATSNNGVIDFGTSGAAWGTANFFGLFDDETAGECWAYLPIAAPIVIDNGDPVSIGAGSVQFVLGITGGLSDYAANRIIDLVWRGQAWDWPASFWLAYVRTTPTNATPGSEPTGGGYARQEVGRSATEWDLSDGRVSNAIEIAWAMPTANQGVVTHLQIMDASGVGNLLAWSALAGSKSLTPGGLPPRIDPDGLGVTFA